MERHFKDFNNLATFDNLPRIHDSGPLTYRRHDSPVVGDKKYRHARLLLKVLQEREYFGLNGHVKRRSWFISNQEFWLAGECEGDGDALGHDARKFERTTFPNGVRVRKIVRCPATDSFRYISV